VEFESVRRERELRRELLSSGHDTTRHGEWAYDMGFKAVVFQVFLGVDWVSSGRRGGDGKDFAGCLFSRSRRERYSQVALLGAGGKRRAGGRRRRNYYFDWRSNFACPANVGCSLRSPLPPLVGTYCLLAQRRAFFFFFLFFFSFFDF
jgi:hypothetical protein